MILTVNMQEQTYDVVVERNSLNSVDKYFDLNRKVLIVTDDGVPSEYSKTIKDLSKEGYIYTTPPPQATTQSLLENDLLIKKSKIFSKFENDFTNHPSLFHFLMHR